MRPTIALLLGFAVIGVASGQPAANPAAPHPRYHLTDPGPGPNGTVSIGRGLSPSGQIAGCWTMPGGHNVPNHAWLWDGEFIQLWSAAPNGDSEAKAINGKNQVVGWVTYRGAVVTCNHAALWLEDKATDLNGQQSDAGTAVAINDAGEIVVTSMKRLAGGEWQPRAYVWKNGKETNLEPLADLPGCNPVAINARGVVVGKCSHGAARLRAVRWEGGKPFDLGLLPQCLNAQATAINDAGQIVGTCWGKLTLHHEEHQADGGVSVRSWTTREGPLHPFLWENGKMRELPRLEGDTTPHAINNKGQIVGSVSDEERRHPRAVLWENGKLLDLNDLIPAGTGWTLRDAVAVNDRGQILVDALGKGRAQCLLLTPN